MRQTTRLLLPLVLPCLACAGCRPAAEPPSPATVSAASPAPEKAAPEAAPAKLTSTADRGTTTAVESARSEQRSADRSAARPASLPQAPKAAATDWPQFRGPGGMGVSPDGNVPVSWSATEGIKWKTEVGPGTSSPIILGARVYLTSYGGTYDQPARRLLCLDRDSGSILWDKTISGTGPEESRIREDHGWASSTPATDGVRIYAFFGRSGVCAFDMAGKQLWRAEVGDRPHGWGSAASPVLFGDLVIVNGSVESDSLVALNKVSGKEVWRATNIKEAWNTPLLVSLPGGKTELVMAVFQKVLGFDPKTGEQLWSCDTQINWYMVPSLVASDGIVYCIGGRTGGALAVRAGGRGDVTATHRVWSGQRGSNVSSPVLHEGHLYWAKDSPPAAYCADAKTGQVVYEERMDRAAQVYASVVLAGGRLYYVGRNGRTYVVRAAPKFEVLAENDLGERSMFNASPAVAGGRLFIRSDRYLYCIGS